MNIHERMRELTDLAHIYAEDGAFLTAANTLRKMADELDAHHYATMPQRPLTAAAIRTAHRDELVKRLADEFEASGIKYTCGAVVMDFAKPRILQLTEEAPYREYRTHHMFGMRKLTKYVWIEVHKRFNQ